MINMRICSFQEKKIFDFENDYRMKENKLESNRS